MEKLDKINDHQRSIVQTMHQQINMTALSVDQNTFILSATQQEQGDILNQIRNLQNEQCEGEFSYKKIDTAKLKFRKLKQRLSNMCYKHQDYNTGKEVTSTNKPRIMKLSIQLQKQINNQLKDYNNIEATMKQLLKILEQKRENDVYHKRQNDLHVLRQSKCIPLLMEFCKKLPSFCRNEFRQCFKLLQPVNRILQLFCTLGVNRQYLILTNRVPTLSALLILLIKREQSNDPYIISNLYNIITGLLDHKLQGEYGSLIEQTIQYLHQCSLVKRTVSLFQTLIDDNSFTSQHLIKSGCRFLISVLEHTDHLAAVRPIDQIPSISQSTSCLSNIEQIMNFFNQYAMIGLPDKQSRQKTLLESHLPVSSISYMLLITQITYMCCKLNLQMAQKLVNDQILTVISFSLRYSKQFCQQSEDLKQLLNRTILLIGYLSYENEALQNKINQYHIISDLCNLPTKFVVDKRAIQVLVPTLCCLIYKNQINIKSVFAQLSTLYVKNFLKTQMQHFNQQKTIRETPGILTRKSSLNSLNSVNTQCSSIVFQTNTAPSIYSLKIRFPQQDWNHLFDVLDPLQ